MGELNEFLERHNIARIDEVGDEGLTAMHVAFNEGNLEVVKALVAQGLDINVEDGAGNVPLMLAAEKGKLDIIKWACRNGADQHHRNQDGDVPIVMAVLGGHLDIVKYLHQLGADLRHRCDNLFTLTMIAAENFALHVLVWLYEQGCPLDEIDNAGNTLTILAAAKGDTDILKWLHEKGCPLRCADSAGTTPFLAAAMNGHVAIMEWLVSQDISWNDDTYATSGESITGSATPAFEWLREQQEEKEFWTYDDLQCAAIAALRAGHLAVLQWLHANGYPFSNGETKWKLIVAAFDGKSMECLRWLLNVYRIPLDTPGDLSDILFYHVAKYDDTIQMFSLLWDCFNGLINNIHPIVQNAAQYGSLTVLQFLFERLGQDCLNIHLTMPEVGSFVHAALYAENMSVLEWLNELNVGMLYDLRDSAGNDPVCIAAKGGMLEKLIWLVDVKGCTLDTFNEDEDWPLSLAIRQKSLDCVKWMHEVKKVPLKQDDDDDDGEVLMNVAIMVGYLPVAQWIYETIGEPLEKTDVALDYAWIATSHGFPDILEWLFEIGPYTIMEDGPLLFMGALRYGNLSCAQYLLDQGIPITATDEEGNHAAILSAAADQIASLEWLEMKGANLKAKGPSGIDAMMAAAEMGNLEAMKWMKANGVPTNATDNNGHTAIFFAAAGGSVPCLSWLATNGCSIDTPDPCGLTPLIIAACAGGLGAVQWLANNGASMKRKTLDGSTAMSKAYERGKMEIVQYLASQGCSLND